MFEIITPEIQRKFEMHMNKKETDGLPIICGYYGRACRCMGKPANHMPCLHCPLAKFAEKLAERN